MTNLFLIAQGSSTNWLIIICIFGAIVTGVYLLAEFVLGSKTRSESRLDRLSGRTDVEDAAPKASISDMLTKYTPKITESLKPKSEKEINSRQQLLNEAGWRADDASKLLTSIQFFCAIGGFVFGGGVGIFSAGFSPWTVMYAVAFAGVGWYVPHFALVFVARGRKQKLFLGLPDSLDLMVVCVEAGLGMDQALRRVAEEMVDTHPVVAHEFQTCNQQL